MANEDKHGKTLFIRNLPYSTTNEGLEKIFSDIGPLKSCFIVGDKDTGKCRGFGYVKFTLMEDAQKALQTVKKVGERNIQMMYAKKKEKQKKFGVPKADTEEKEEETKETEECDENEKTDEKVPVPRKKKHKDTDKQMVTPKKGEKQAVNPYNEGKRARLIVRNLSFKCGIQQLKEAFSEYGEIVDVHIPTKGGGRKLGFGFVQFSTKAEAGMAVKGANGKSILSRKVAVDFTLPKEKFEKRAEELRSKAPAEEDESEEEDMEVDHQSDDEQKEEESEDEEDEESEEEMQVEIKGRKRKASTNSDEEDDDDSDDEEDEEESDEEDEEESDEEDDDSDTDDDSDDDGEKDEAESDSDSGIEAKHMKQNRESDVSEGRTIFMRNLPFNTTEEELQVHFSTFGDINYTRIVTDRETGISRGTAFVQFKSKSSADDCLNDTHILGGRELTVSLAVTREKAVELVGKKDKPKEQKDSRNLYLVREGMIRPGTDQAKDIPPADLVRRQKIDAQKRKKLKDQDVFVSSTRLCIHNLPTSITDKQLRTIVLKAAGDKKAKVIECRIMRDLNRVNTEGKAKSRGYAFCAFSQHEHAVEVLRSLNNNPETFGPHKRPIVEFSLESHKALEMKQKRFEKSQFKQKQKQAAAQSNAESGKKKKKKLKQKINARPLEARKEQDKVARSLHKGSIGLPSHAGPKQRHKPRHVEADKKMKKKPSFIKNLQQPKQRESQKIPKELKQKSRRQKPDTDSFDKLVASYKKKISFSGGFS